MWLQQLFVSDEIDFEARCRGRIVASALYFILGMAAFLMVVMTDGQIPRLFAFEKLEGSSIIPGFYVGTGLGLMVSAALTIFKNARYLRNTDAGKKRRIVETDERNRMMGLRCWAYSGYVMFFLLYAGMLVGGFFSEMVVIVLLVVAAVYALLLGGFRMMLTRMM